MTPSKHGFQADLFRFFSKTPSPAKKNKRSSPPTLSKESTRKRKQSTTIASDTRLKLPPRAKNSVSTLKVGMSVKVYWPIDDDFYEAKIIFRKGNTSVFTLHYTDGEKETVDMETEIYEVLVNTEAEPDGCLGGIQDKVDSEDDDEGSVFKKPIDESSGQAGELNWDEAEEENGPPKNRTMLNPMAHRKPEAKLEEKSETKPITEHNRVTPMQWFSSIRTESATSTLSVQPKSLFFTPTQTQSLQNSDRKSTPKAYEAQKGFTVTPQPPIKCIPNFKDTDKVVLERKGHVHNYLNFVQNPCDLKKRPVSHPEYDGSTLYVDFREIEQVQGKQLSELQQQWWKIKQYYNDCILICKRGLFYDFYSMDADVSTKILNHNYMKGACAHSCAPETAYGAMVDKLVKAGYKVARVEQTESTEELEIRAKKLSSKTKPNIVNREVCSVVSIGTRKSDYMYGDYTEDGPLLIIREEMLSCDEQDGYGNSVKATCEYGITIVDAVRSIITMGQFADDVLRSRMHTVLTNYSPSEIILPCQVSSYLRTLIKSTRPTARLETINDSVIYPNSTALDPRVRKSLERPSPAHPWDIEETYYELHRHSYFSIELQKNGHSDDISSWPTVLQTCVNEKAHLAMSSFGAALYTLQRYLIANEILRKKRFRAYIPSGENSDALCFNEQSITHLELDASTLKNLEILSNQHDSSSRGSLWEKVNYALTPHGRRLLRAWLLRPLFQKADIERRQDAVTECLSGEVALAIEEARIYLSKCGDLERYINTIFSITHQEDDHPSSRIISSKDGKNSKRKLEFFCKMLSGMQSIARVRECFNRVLSFQSELLEKTVRNLVPDQMESELNWFSENFDCKNAASGNYEPLSGLDSEYDAACEEIESIKQQLEDYKDKICRNFLTPRARTYWKYTNTALTPSNSDKYLIELPASIDVPEFFVLKGKRGKGAKEVIKYKTPTIAGFVIELEKAMDVQEKCRERGILMIIARFNAKRPMWEAATLASALLDALQSLTKISSSTGFVKPLVLVCSADNKPKFDVRKGRHPLVSLTHDGGEFMPNDLILGGNDAARVLLLSGPNMGGKSTLLRQTCLIILLAQIGCYVPAERFSFTPIDKIFTRLDATDRILDGYSPFSVELLETSAALHGATRRSLVIMDELGHGTSTFDGTAIANASLYNLVHVNKSLVLFATHYHSLLEDWRNCNAVRLGHMECIQTDGANDVAFCYTLGNGVSPKSFGINVAKMAGLPCGVLEIAKHESANFEQELLQRTQDNDETEDKPSSVEYLLRQAVETGDIDGIMSLHMKMQSFSGQN